MKINYIFFPIMKKVLSNDYLKSFNDPVGKSKLPSNEIVKNVEQRG